MKFSRLSIPDIVECQPFIHKDDRGYFMETLIHDKLESFLGFKINFCQENQTNSSRGVLRGLHYQIAPFAQNKLVRVVNGAVLDVIVDVRKKSPTFGSHVSIEISAKNKKQLFIPAGFAHGFVALTDNTVFLYKVDNYYKPICERGIAYDDRDLAIDWRFNINELKLSEKDANLPLFKNADYYENFQ
tara:strand:+ start:60 stop:620 length:561 start_codon:yes stop_codon:yes gene_type:complete